MPTRGLYQVSNILVHVGELVPQLSTNTWTYRFKTALDGPAVIQSAPDRLKWVHYVVRSTTLCTRTRKNPRLQTHPTLDSENFWSCLVYEPQCPQRMGPVLRARRGAPTRLGLLTGLLLAHGVLTRAPKSCLGASERRFYVQIIHHSYRQHHCRSDCSYFDACDHAFDELRRRVVGFVQGSGSRVKAGQPDRESGEGEQAGAANQLLHAALDASCWNLRTLWLAWPRGGDNYIDLLLCLYHHSAATAHEF